jgi:penicillin G amidase
MIKELFSAEILSGLVSEAAYLSDNKSDMPFWLRVLCKPSLPCLDGVLEQPLLNGRVTITRDSGLGVPDITGKTREDVSYALGFVHAQDRFPQMDLMRRLAAGELAELLGTLALKTDKQNRLWQFRTKARDTLATLPASEKKILVQYSRGVNAGLAALAGRHVEYFALLTAPTDWKDEDTLLVLYALSSSLQQSQIPRLYARGWFAKNTRDEQLTFLMPDSSEWDTPLTGTPPVPPVVPGSTPPAWWGQSSNRAPLLPSEQMYAGSNGWVVDSQHSVSGHAMLANDMHLELMLPNDWYRAKITYCSEKGENITLSGLTLPGLPATIVGSNGSISWGITNAYASTFDFIRTSAPVTEWPVHQEVIKVRKLLGGYDNVELNIPVSPWGPVVPTEEGNLAMRWVLQLPQAISLNFLSLNEAGSVREAIDIAKASGMPAVNLMLADKEGHIGWTLAGGLPQRLNPYENFTYPLDETSEWGKSILAADKHPEIIDPQDGILWSANNRQSFDDKYLYIGDGGADIGIRAWEIKRCLKQAGKISDDMMRTIQLDDRAPLIQKWKEVLLPLLNKQVIGHKLRKEAADFITEWQDSAAIDSVGYRLLSTWRDMIYSGIFSKVDNELTRQWPQASYMKANSRWDETVITLINAGKWIPSPYSHWADFLVNQLDIILVSLTSEGKKLREATWGNNNKADIVHPFVHVFSFLRPWFAAPSTPLSGDHNVPHVNRPGFGASSRLAVAPAKEEQGTLTMPGGQSGNPVSPWFLAGHDHWVKGEPLPLQPGNTAHTLILEPEKI